MIEKTFPIAEKLLEEAVKNSHKLLELLKTEEAQLINKTDPSSIADIAQQKKQSVQQLELFNKQFSQVLATEKLQATADDIKNYFNIAKNNSLNISQAFSNWNEMLSIANDCRMLNEKNGASIQILSQHTQRSLHILKGKSQQATTYGPDGSTYNEKQTHSLFSV